MGVFLRSWESWRMGCMRCHVVGRWNKWNMLDLLSNLSAILRSTNTWDHTSRKPDAWASSIDPCQRAQTQLADNGNHPHGVSRSFEEGGVGSKDGATFPEVRLSTESKDLEIVTNSLTDRPGLTPAPLSMHGFWVGRRIEQMLWRQPGSLVLTPPSSHGSIQYLCSQPQWS